MIQRLKEMGGFVVYIFSALIALLLASWMSSIFMSKAVSQTPPAPTPRVEAPAPTVSPGPEPSISTQPGSLLPALGSTNKANPLADIIEDYNYVAKDKRDPFLPFERPQSVAGMVGPLWPLQGFDLDQLKLVGIIWDVKNPKAMITDPTGKGYVVRVNERIGRSNGYIARIREGEIVIVESVNGLDGKITYTTKLIKLQND